MSVIKCADAINPVQIEYCRMVYESNWKSLKQRKRLLFFYEPKHFSNHKSCYIDFYEAVICRDGQ